MNVGNLMASLNLNTSQFTSALKSAVSSASKAARDISNAFGGTAVKGISSMSKALDSLRFKASGTGKDIARITQGIIFSQAFYRSLNMIQSAIGGVMDLAKQAEAATRSFAVLLKNQTQAIALVEHLKSFAAETNFNFQTASDAARQLLAYGFQLGELDSMMRTIGDTAAAMGDTEAFGKVARALGQIKTKGKLATQEILQLTEAGIPAYEILQEKLGLTKDQMEDIGKAGISADVAIKALTAGMQERFGGSMALMSDTVDGYLNNIVESFNAVAAKITEPFYVGFKNVLRTVSNTLSEVWSIVNKYGTGGLINRIFSPEAANVIRQFVGAMQILMASLKNLAQSLAPLFGEFMKIVTTVGGVLIPVIAMFVNALSALAQVVSANTTLMNALRVVITSLVIIKGVILLVRGLATAFAVLSSPITLVIVGVTALIALFATLAGYGGKIVSVVNGIGQSLNKLYGVSNKDILPEEFNDPPTLEGVISDMEDVADSAEDVGDAAKDAGDKAKKAAKNLMAFDEVFTLSDDNDSSDIGDINLDDIEMPDMDAIAGQFDGFDFGFGDLESQTSGLGDAVQAMVDRIKGLASDFSSNVMPMFKDAFDWLFKDTNMKIPLGDAIVEFGKTVYDVIVNTVIPIASDFTSRFIMPIVNGFMQYIMPTLRDMLNSVVQISSSLLDNIGILANGIYNLFKPVIDFIVNVVVGLFEIIYNTWSEYGQQITDAVTGVIDSITRIFMKLITDVLQPIIEPFMEQLQYVWDTHLKGCLQTVLDFLAYLIVVVGEIWVKFVEPICNWLIDVLGPAFVAAFKFIGDVIAAFLAAAGGIIKGVIEVLKGLIEFLMGVFTGDIDRAFGGVKLIFDGFNSAVKGIIDAIVMVLNGFIDMLTYRFSEKWSFVWDALKNIIRIFGEGIKEYFDAIVTVFKGVLEFLTGVFTGDWSRAWDGIKMIFKGIIDAIIAIAKTFALAIWEVIKSIATGVMNTFSALSEWMKTNMTGTYSNIMGIINAIKQIFGGLIDFVVGVFTGNWSRAWQGVVDIFGGIFNGIKAVVKAPLNYIIDIVNFAISGINGLIWTINKVPGIDIPNIPKIPALARGGVVTRHTLAEIGEGNKKEAVIPLENGNAIDMIASRIMEGMQSMAPAQPQMAYAGGYDSGQQQPIMYVGTLIADDRSLRELERKMQVIRQGETRRRG